MKQNYQKAGKGIAMPAARNDAIYFVLDFLSLEGRGIR
jgi:hypothetical protein